MKNHNLAKLSNGNAHAGMAELRKCAGFTVIELLVVIAIIAILIALLEPAPPPPKTDQKPATTGQHR